MRAVMGWCAICAVLLLAALFMRSLPTSWHGSAVTLALFLASLGLLVKICRG